MNSKSLAEYFLNRGCLCNLKPSPSPISLYLLKNNYLSEFKNDSELVLENLGISEILLGLLEDIDAIASEVGGHYVYRYKNSATKPNKPDTGTDGSSDGWTESPTDPQEGTSIWMSQTYVLETYGVWSEPVKITGSDGWTITPSTNALIITLSTSNLNDFGLPFTITFTAKRGNTTAEVGTITATQFPNMGLDFITSTSGTLVVNDYNKVGNSYITRGSINCTVPVTYDGVTEEFVVVIPVAVNLTGSWLRQIEGDTLEEVAQKLQYGYDHPGSSQLTVLETFGKYIKSSTEMTSEIRLTIEDPTAVNTFSSYMSQTATSWKTEITDGLELAGIYIDSHQIKCKANKFGIYNSNDEQTFSVDLDGNLVGKNAGFKGKITATSGTIGGWSISSDKLSASKDVEDPIMSSTSVELVAGEYIEVAFWNISGVKKYSKIEQDSIKLCVRGRDGQIFTRHALTTDDASLFNGELEWSLGEESFTFGEYFLTDLTASLAASEYLYGNTFINGLLNALASKEITAEVLKLNAGSVNRAHIEFDNNAASIVFIPSGTYTPDTLDIWSDTVTIECETQINLNGDVMFGGDLYIDPNAGLPKFKYNDTWYNFDVSAAVTAGILTT